MRTRLPVLLVLAAALSMARAAFASPVPAPAAPADGLRPGAEVTTVVPELPQGAREFELVLLPEGGEPIQMTPELPAGARAVRWRMPRTCASRARLVVRSGDAHDEWRSQASAAFALATPGPDELAQLIAGCAGIGARWDLAGDPATALGDARAPEHLAPAYPLPHAAPAPAAPALTIPDLACSALVHDAGAPSGAPPDIPTFSSAASFRPLRN
jgi:hypothetical protein